MLVEKIKRISSLTSALSNNHHYPSLGYSICLPDDRLLVYIVSWTVSSLLCMKRDGIILVLVHPTQYSSVSLAIY